jgi:hypothetical protein
MCTRPAAHAGLDAGGTAAMTGPHLCEYEQWPGSGGVPTGRKPTPYVLALLAADYGTDSYHLLDLDDYRHLPAADRLILDKHTRAVGHNRDSLTDGQRGAAGQHGRTDSAPSPLPRVAQRPEPPAQRSAWRGARRHLLADDDRGCLPPAGNHPTGSGHGARSLRR